MNNSHMAIHFRPTIAFTSVLLSAFGIATTAFGDEPTRLPANAANQFGAVEASGLRWQHLSSRHGDLPAPGESTQQTGAVTADLFGFLTTEPNA